MQLLLKQGCRGKNKQRMDTNPPANPTETRSAVLVSYSITPAATPPKRGKFCYRNSGLGLSQKDRQLCQGCGHPPG